MKGVLYFMDRIGIRGGLIVVAAAVLAIVLFHASYRMITGLSFPLLPVGRTALHRHFAESISPDGSYRVRLEGGESSRVQLSVIPSSASIDNTAISDYVMLDTNWDAKVSYVWKTPQELVVVCPLCTPIRVARQRTHFGALHIEYEFPPPTVDDSTAVIELSPTLPRDEQKEYDDRVHRQREQHPFRF